MTVQNLYTKYLNGEVTKQKFLYEVRRDQNLTMISPSNSFDDVVKILKNKSIISEKAAKESTGKQEVEIIAKTIDMVNPYEYNRGMEYELNIMDVPATSGDLSEENILKAQKKVLTNLTKNPQYYCEKVHGKGEVSEEWVEATKKEIEKIGKGKSKIIREGVERDTNLSSKFSNKEILTVIAPHGKYKELLQYMQSLLKSGDEFEDLDDYVEDFKNYVADKSLEETKPGYHPDGTPKSNDEMSDDEKEAFYNDSDFLDEGAINSDYKYIYKVLKNKYPEIIGNWDIVKSFVDMHIDDIEITDKNSIIQEFENYLSVNPEILNLDEHGQYADRVADVNADSTPLKEKKLRIYEKYAQKWNKTVDEIKAMVEASTYAGKDAVDDLKKDPKFGTLSSTAKSDVENKLKKGETVTIG